MPINANNTTILYDNFALAAYLRSVGLTTSTAMIDGTTLADTSMVNYPGLNSTSFTMSGLFDTATGAGSLLDDKDATEVALSCILVEITEQTPLGIGWQLINGEWTAPRETDNGY